MTQISTVWTRQAKCCHKRFIPIIYEDPRFDIYDTAFKHKEFLMVRMSNSSYKFMINYVLKDFLSFSCFSNLGMVEKDPRLGILQIIHYNSPEPMMNNHHGKYLKSEIDIHKNNKKCMSCFYCIRGMNPEEYLTTDIYG